MNNILPSKLQQISKFLTQKINKYKIKKGERQIIINNHSKENVIVKFSKAGSFVTISFKKNK